MTVPAFYDTFRIKSRCKTPLSFKLWFPAANLKNICRGRCSHQPAGTRLPPNIPPQPSHHLKSQGRAFLHSPDFNLSSLWQHRTIPALRLKHRSGGCGTASALPKCSIMSGCGTCIVLRGKSPSHSATAAPASVRCFRHWRRSPLQHPVLSALLAWHLPHLARRIGT